MPGPEALGWMAALCSMLAFGSFGVPIKSEAANSVDIDPLVFQSYKSFVCFATSWLVLLAGVPFSFTPWGIVSCLFWVPGGVATVFAIRNAGLAIAIGMGSSSIVLVSFVWGIFIFDEEIHSRIGASAAIAMMMTGILGMSFYSAPPSQQLQSSSQGEQQLVHVLATTSSVEDTTRFVAMTSQDDNDNTIIDTVVVPYSDDPSPQDGITHRNVVDGSAALAPTAAIDETTPVTPEEAFEPEYQEPLSTGGGAHDPLERLNVCGMLISRRQLGIAGALFNGIWGGSIMVPLHWCHDRTSGEGYLISFGIGAAVVTTFLWVIRFGAKLWQHQGSVTAAYQSLPCFHLRIMWRAGGTSGLLWSIGNFFSILSVYYLGEGVGYSVVQAGMLVSGLWGIFYFREIQGTQTIAKWLASACITICGIILLSYEHHKK